MHSNRIKDTILNTHQRCTRHSTFAFNIITYEIVELN